ncbi:MAG TPA: biotin/lipoyl-containing protein [Gemmatimonadales bacterium]|nr:biotin/lipoyl-containing protein [Gemmatimonadales bacterium]
MKYFVTVDGREFVVEVDGDRVRADGQEFIAHLGSVPGTPLRHLLVGDRSVTLAIEGGKGQWQVARHGNRREIDIVDERTRHIRTLTGESGVKRGIGALKAPMPGLVVRIPVSEGQKVAAGASLLVLEAMKMENELRASGEGTVKTIRVRAGQAVEKGEVLIEFADP